MFKSRNRDPAALRAFPARCSRGIEAARCHIHGALQTAAGCTGGHRGAALTRWAAGIIFLVFGVAKFSDHAAELASFRHYPLPAPEVFVYLAGVIEIGGGLLLIVGLLTRLAALALAADMVGAIVVSGLARGELISLTLAPLLLVVMITLIRAGAGCWSVDRQMARKAASRHGPHPGHARHHLVVRPSAPGGQPRS
jgi:putative oxidoreductase